jgi:hypothetical protein
LRYPPGHQYPRLGLAAGCAFFDKLATP